MSDSTVSVRIGVAEQKISPISVSSSRCTRCNGKTKETAFVAQDGAARANVLRCIGVPYPAISQAWLNSRVKRRRQLILGAVMKEKLSEGESIL